MQLESKYPDRIVGIDASRSIDEIKADIYIELGKILKKRGNICL